jgi:hypothetical protein
MYSTISAHDYTYNREFQRMRYLSEEPVQDDPTQNITDQQLRDLGYNVQPRGNNHKFDKKTSHFKYF